MNNAEFILDQLKIEFRRRIFEESIPRIKKCLNELTEEEVWYRPNENTVSIGNLCLHLCGNVRQWILSGLGKVEDNRNRPLEFSEKGPLPSAYLIAEMDKLQEELEQLIDNLKIEDLVNVHPVQVYEETGVSIIVHVIEHFSYHTGQITWAVKSRKNVDMQYYPDIE